MTDTNTNEAIERLQEQMLAQFAKINARLDMLLRPDAHAPGFAKEAARQAALLHGQPEEQEAMDFIEAAFDWSEP